MVIDAYHVGHTKFISICRYITRDGNAYSHVEKIYEYTKKQYAIYAACMGM